MGMFDNVKYEAPCPKCGAVQTEWQSKDGNCFLETLEPWQVSHFYCMCRKCGQWIDASVDAEVEKTVTVKKCDVTLTMPNA